MATEREPPAYEHTPLIAKDASAPRKSLLKTIHYILLCGFLVSFSFGVTQVPIVYVFRLMTCQAYYETHEEPEAGFGGDRCSVHEIEAGTARAIALMGASTTFFGIINLFITGWGIKRFGVKTSLAIQVFWPAIRLLIQNIGVMLGGRVGIIIMQCSQIITIVGGPNGYMLALNTFVADVCEQAERTPALGRLQGCTMLGSAFGFLLGGILAEAFSIITPFQVTLALFLVSTLYVLVFLPWIPLEKEQSNGKTRNGAAGLLAPMKVLLPSKWITKQGKVQREFGALVVAAGAFLAVLATGYLATLLQLYATDVFGFKTRRNSYLVSMYSFLRGVFLMFAFPRIITAGRAYMARRSKSRLQQPKVGVSVLEVEVPNDQVQIANAMTDEEERDVTPPKPASEQQTFEFDLIYTRFSLLVDGMLTLCAGFVQEGWQMYLVAFALPFGAGTASASKGTILQMCNPDERTDALSAISLVENMGRLSTTFVFGLIFAAFANMGKTWLVFVCNAGVALVGFCVLLLARFPPEGSVRLEGKHEVDEDET